MKLIKQKQINPRKMWPNEAQRTQRDRPSVSR